MNNKMKQKVVIWGYKNSSHTHGYIHSSYYKAFKYLGYETYWFNDVIEASGFNFDNCIFLTEDQVQHNIPLNKTCKYILHHVPDLSKYLDNGLDYIYLANYLKWCDDGYDKCYNEGNKVEKINDCTFWDESTKTIHQPWATNLTPNEINTNSALKYNQDESNVNYIGMSHENSGNINIFAEAVSMNGKIFNITMGKTDDENSWLIRNSYVSADLRGDWHKECGYLPCRVFKNISYGRLTGTNSENVKKVLGDHVIYEDNPELLFHKIVEAEQMTPLSKIKDNMNYIKTHHTYVNRINNLLKFL